MKCNILKFELDYNLLDKAIETHHEEEHDLPQYLAMNWTTYYHLIGDLYKNMYIHAPIIKMNAQFSTTYKNIPIILDYNLRDGEIEIK